MMIATERNESLEAKSKLGNARLVLLSLWKGAARYAFHVFVLYLVVAFSNDTLPDFLYRRIFPVIHSHTLDIDQMQFFFSHLIAFSILPAFLSGLSINAKFGHGVARFVWVVPICLLAMAILFVAPRVYPTMTGDSDFLGAVHYFFGAIHLRESGVTIANLGVGGELYQMHLQFRFTAPAYAGIGYSMGAALGMSTWSRGLQRLFERSEGPSWEKRRNI